MPVRLLGPSATYTTRRHRPKMFWKPYIYGSLHQLEFDGTPMLGPSRRSIWVCALLIFAWCLGCWGCPILTQPLILCSEIWSRGRVSTSSQASEPRRRVSRTRLCFLESLQGAAKGLFACVTLPHVYCPIVAGANGSLLSPNFVGRLLVRKVLHSPLCY